MQTSFGTVGLVFSLTTAAIAADPDISGDWARGDGNARVKIAQCGDDLCATNTWVRDTSGKEAVGDTLVMSLQASGDNKLDGRAYDRRRKLSYSMQVSLGDGMMTSRGCIISGVICKSMTWSRVGQ